METVSAVMARQAVSQALNNKVVVDVVRKQVRGSSAAAAAAAAAHAVRVVEVGRVVGANDALVRALDGLC